MCADKPLKQDIVLKPPTSFKEQVEIFKSRGLIVEDESFACDVLSKVNYYRFSAYLLPFRDASGTQFMEGTNFNQIHRTYEFDQRLRNLILSAIEPIEILLRTQIAHYHAHKYGAEGYIDPGNFENTVRHERFIKEFNDAIIKNQKALFVMHHFKNYGGHFPVWVAVELFSFGMLSKFYANMKHDDKKRIAKTIFLTGPQHLRSWLVCITDLRNRCAHYMRLYYHNFVTYPKLPRGEYTTGSRRVFDIIYVMKYLYLDQDKWKNGFVRTLESIISQYDDDINLEYIGFPDNWLELLEKNLQSKKKH